MPCRCQSVGSRHLDNNDFQWEQALCVPEPVCSMPAPGCWLCQSTSTLNKLGSWSWAWGSTVALIMAKLPFFFFFHIYLIPRHIDWRTLRCPRGIPSQSKDRDDAHGGSWCWWCHCHWRRTLTPWEAKQWPWTHSVGVCLQRVSPYNDKGELRLVVGSALWITQVKAICTKFCFTVSRAETWQRQRPYFFCGDLEGKSEKAANQTMINAFWAVGLHSRDWRQQQLGLFAR